MKTPYRILLAGLAFAAVSLGNAFSQEASDKAKKPQRPPVEEKKADNPKKPAAKSPAPESKRPPKAPPSDKKAAPPKPPKKPAGPPQAGKGPQRPGQAGASPEEMAKVREQMRQSFEEIQKLRQAGKEDEARKKLAEVKKKAEAVREKFGGPGGPLSFGQRGPGQGRPSGPLPPEMQEQMRQSFEEIQKLRQAGKDDEAARKMAEVRKKVEAMREKFGGRGGPMALGQRGPGPGKGAPQKRPDSDSRDEAKRPDPPRPPAKPAPESHKQAAAKPSDHKGPPHHRGDHDGRPKHHGDRDGHPDHRGHGDRDHHRGPESRGDGDDKSKHADSRRHHDRGPGKWAQHARPPFAKGPAGAFHKGPRGPQMMMHRMMMMKRMAMMARTQAGKGGGFSARGRGPGNWGAQHFSPPFMQRGPRSSLASPKLRMMQAKRAAAAKAGKPGKAGKKARRAEKRGNGKEGKGRGVKECEKCQESGKDKDG